MNAKKLAEALLKSDKLDIKLNVPIPIIPTVYDGPNIQAVLTSAIAPHLLDAERLAEWLVLFEGEYLVPRTGARETVPYMFWCYVREVDEYKPTARMDLVAVLTTAIAEWQKSEE